MNKCKCPECVFYNTFWDTFVDNQVVSISDAIFRVTIEGW